MLGIISGSGLYEIEGLKVKESLDVDTPYGKPSGPVMKCEYNERVIHFLPRHGRDHSIPPHKVNYRANIWALKELGVQRIISVSAVGGINKDCSPGHIVIGDQIMDFTKNRITLLLHGKECKGAGIRAQAPNLVGYCIPGDFPVDATIFPEYFWCVF